MTEDTNLTTEDDRLHEVAHLDGGELAEIYPDRSAALSAVLADYLAPGSNIIVGAQLSGSTLRTLDELAEQHQAQVRFADACYPEQFTEADERSTVVLVEVMGDPRMNVVDVAKWADFSRSLKLPLVVDNINAGPRISQAVRQGAAASLVSAHPGPPGLGPVGLVRSGQEASIQDAPASPPDDDGLGRATEAVARALRARPDVVWVRYPWLDGDDYRETVSDLGIEARANFFAFGVGSPEKAAEVVAQLSSDVFSLACEITHSASTTHAGVPTDLKALAGVREDGIRVAISDPARADRLLQAITEVLDRLNHG